MAFLFIYIFIEKHFYSHCIFFGEAKSPQNSPLGAELSLNDCWCANTCICKIMSVVNFLAQSVSHISMGDFEYRAKHLLTYVIVPWVMNIIASVNRPKNGK